MCVALLTPIGHDGSMSENIKIINAALTRGGNSQITSLDDGSVEAEIASANYEEVVWEELCDHPWSFARKEAELNLLAETPINEWSYVFEEPSDMLELITVRQNKISIPYERNGEKIYTNATNTNTPVYAEYIVRIDEISWPGKFRAAIIERLEALFLRALNEDYESAEVRERDAEVGNRRARFADSKNQTPRRRKVSRLTSVRRA